MSELLGARMTMSPLRWGRCSRFNGSNSAALVELRDDPVDAQQCGGGNSRSGL